MAKAATRESVAKANQPADYGAALAIINGRIADAKTRQSKAGGEASQAWASIEKMGIHKGGAQMAAKIIAIDDEDERQDLLRSFSKLLEAAGVAIDADIVDIAQGKEPEAVPTRKRRSADDAKPGPAGDHDLAGEDGPVIDPAAADVEKVTEAAAQVPARRQPAKGNMVRIAEAKKAAQAHLGDRTH